MLPIHETLYLVGSCFGAVLYGLLARAAARRQVQEPRFRVLRALVTCLLLWHAGQTVAAFTTLLVGRPVAAVNRLALPASFLGLGLTPSLLVHVLVAYTLAGRRPRRPWIPALLYLPALAVPWPLARLWAEPAAPPGLILAGWLGAASAVMVLGLSVGAVLASGLGTRPREPREARFFRAFAATLAAAAVLVALAFLAARDAWAPLVLAASLFPVLPGLVLGWHVYRYHYLDLRLHRSAVALALAAASILFYLWVVSLLSTRAQETLGLNKRLVEALLILVPLLAARASLARLEGAVERWRTGGGGALVHVSEDLARRVEEGRLDLAGLRSETARSVQEAVGIERVRVLSAEEAGRDYPTLVDFLEAEGLPLVWREEAPSEAARALDGMDARWVFPVRRRGRVAALLVLGGRAEPLSADECGVLVGLCAQVALAMDHLRVAEEKLALERRMHRYETLEGLGRLSASVAHRVKNPLSSIKALTQTVREGLPEGDRRREDLGVVVEEVDRLAAVTDQLLAFARPRPAAGEAVDLAALADDAVELMRHEAADRVVLRTEHDGGAGDLRVRGDPVALREVVLNLVQNGIQAMGEAGGGLWLRTRREDGSVLLEVEDEGPGVPTGLRDRVFQPFFTTRPGGTGLGLAIVRQRVEGMGGTVDVGQGALGRGAVFRVRLPSTEGAA